jgi:hypothetical protein
VHLWRVVLSQLLLVSSIDICWSSWFIMFRTSIFLSIFFLIVLFIIETDVLWQNFHCWIIFPSFLSIFHHIFGDMLLDTYICIIVMSFCWVDLLYHYKISISATSTNFYIKDYFAFCDYVHSYSGLVTIYMVHFSFFYSLFVPSNLNYFFYQGICWTMCFYCI